MNTVHAHGLLAHHFWGSYCATVVLEFRAPEHAADALTVLGEPWKASNKNQNVLVWNGDSKALEGLKDKLASYGADRKKIDSIGKSIDYGEPFECQIPVTPKEQMSLL